MISAPPHFGVFNVAKPEGMTSRQVVDRVLRLVRPDKAGHAGTLDPLATGVLVVCVGKATRLIDVIQDSRKSYRARFVLGHECDTDDVTGTITSASGMRDVLRSEIEAILPSFVGRIAQVPPRFSAVHVEGVRAYKRARRGEVVDLTARDVDVFRLELTSFTFPEFELEIECGSGTYVRSIGRDIGRALGCGAVMAALTRTRIGPYRLEDAVPLDELTAETVSRHLLPALTAVESLPKYHARPDDLDRIRRGNPFTAEVPIETAKNTAIAVFDPEGDLVCLAEFDAERRQLRPRRVFIE